MAVASYTSSVTKVADFGPVPEDASTKSHHVTKNGSVVGFRNPHPSYQYVTPAIMFNRIVWYVDSVLAPSAPQSPPP